MAVVVYVLFTYGIPSPAFRSVVAGANAVALSRIAPYAAGLLLLIAGISALTARRRRELLERRKNAETLRAIGWQEFEALVGEAYRRKGYAVTFCGGGGADGVVDLVLRRNGKKLLVQCKHWKTENVGVKAIRELYGVVAAERAAGGIVISSGTFTEEAGNFARGKPMELLDGAALFKLIGEVRKAPVYKSTEPDGSACPLCGAAMVLRTARHGLHVNARFWGCANFPKCKGTRPYDA